MFLLSLVATYQLWRVPLKAGLSTYNPLELTAHSAGFVGLFLAFSAVGRSSAGALGLIVQLALEDQVHGKPSLS